MRVTKNSNEADQKRSADEMKHREREAERARYHEIILDERRAVRALRQGVYLRVAVAVRQVVSFMNRAAEQVMSGEVPSGQLDLESPETTVALG
jgi:hypothetical protein